MSATFITRALMHSATAVLLLYSQFISVPSMDPPHVAAVSSVQEYAYGHIIWDGPLLWYVRVLPRTDIILTHIKNIGRCTQSSLSRMGEGTQFARTSRFFYPLTLTMPLLPCFVVLIVFMFVSRKLVGIAIYCPWGSSTHHHAEPSLPPRRKLRVQNMDGNRIQHRTPRARTSMLPRAPRRWISYFGKGAFFLH